MKMLTDEISRNSTGGTLPALAGRSPTYKIKRVEYVDHDGNKRFEQCDYEVKDLEAFREQLKGTKYADVFFVYEAVWTG